MPSELQWKAIDIYQLTSNFIWQNPVQWDSKKREFSVNIWSIRIIPWHFSFFVASFGYVFLGTAFPVLRQLISPRDHVSTIQCLLLFALCGVLVFCSTINLAILTSGSISTIVVNKLIAFLNNLVQIVAAYKKKTMQRVLIGIRLQEASTKEQQNNSAHEGLATFSSGPNEQLVNPKLKKTGCKFQSVEKWAQSTYSSFWNSSSGEFDMLGFVMITAVVTLTVIFPIVWISAFVVILSFLDLGIVPWEIVIKEMFEYYNVKSSIASSLLVSLFHLSFGIPVILVCLRGLPLLIVFMIIPLQIQLKSISLLDDLHDKMRIASSESSSMNKLFFEYSKIKILNISATGYTAVEVTFLFCLGGFVSVGANFATLRLHSVLPWYLYAVVPPVAVIVMLIIRLLLPYGINVHEYCDVMLKKWKSKVSPKDKFGKRKINSFKTLRWYTGIYGFNFFLIQNSLKVGYYYVILDYTINALMSIPPSALI